MEMPDRTEREKMLAGELYDPNDPEIKVAHKRAELLYRRFNSTEDEEVRCAVLRELLGKVGKGVNILPPLYVDFGSNIYLGDKVYMNFGCVILDCAQVRIGSGVMFGPSVQVYAATHPVEPVLRASGLELARPITIGDNVWVGGGAIICPGVTIGENSVIGAGAVVTRDIPPNVVAVGNPARVIRQIAGRI
jgi:maltose O-acetyltransferase